jgi:hypothetical protein
MLEEPLVPPAVRAAEFRILASFPLVKNLGRVPGGIELEIIYGAGPADKYSGGHVPASVGKEWLVVNPATERVRSDRDFSGTVTIDAAGWVNRLPIIITAKNHISFRYPVGRPWRVRPIPGITSALAPSFEPRRGEAPARWHVVRKPSPGPAGGSQEPARRDLSTLRARLTAIPARPATPANNWAV